MRNEMPRGRRNSRARLVVAVPPEDEVVEAVEAAEAVVGVHVKVDDESD